VSKRVFEARPRSWTSASNSENTALSTKAASGFADNLSPKMWPASASQSFLEGNICVEIAFMSFLEGNICAEIVFMGADGWSVQVSNDSGLA
jgi:hypothetical protein